MFRPVSAVNCALLFLLPLLFLPFQGPAAAQETRAQPQNRETAGGTLYDVLRADPRFQTFANLIEATGLRWRFTGPHQQTVFVPPDEVFDEVPGGVADMFAPINRENVQAILLFHLVPGRLRMEKLAGRITKVQTAQRRETLIDGTDPDGIIRRDGAGVTGPAIEATNGLIYPIDSVLLPVGSLDEEDEEDEEKGPAIPAEPGPVT
mgnify:CR=1 FL=1